MHMDVDEVVNLLKSRGLKVTPQRVALFRYVLQRHDHPTAEQVFGEVRKEFPGISLATVYKTLGLMKDAGLVVEIPTGAGSSRYDPDVGFHGHLVNPSTGEVLDFTPGAMAKLHDEVLLELEERGVRASGIRLEVIVDDESWATVKEKVAP
ncbi:MAG: Fur family transcriptional regulator [Promethearchaeota archaeon]